MSLEVIKFAGAELQVAREQSEQIFVALKPICDVLGLDWSNQHKSVAEDPVLNSTVVVITTVGADGKSRDMLCIPLDYLNGWLFKINANRYKDSRRELIIRYQRECYKALAAHFLQSPLQSPSQSPFGSKSTPMPSELEQVRLAAERVARRLETKAIWALRCLASSQGITDRDEFLHLAALAARPQDTSVPRPKSLDCYGVVPISWPPIPHQTDPLHQSTFARGLAKMALS